jgi:hypothetical protein
MTQTNFRRASAALACALALCVTACGDDNNTTGPGAVTGTYTATQLMTTTGGATTNQLAAGASVTLVLNPDGSMAGRLVIPASASPVDQSLNGTWQFTAVGISLASSADTFLRDMIFSVSGNTLVGDQTFGSTRIQIVLTKV